MNKTRPTDWCSDRYLQKLRYEMADDLRVLAGSVGSGRVRNTGDHLSHGRRHGLQLLVLPNSNKEYINEMSLETT